MAETSARRVLLTYRRLLTLAGRLPDASSAKARDDIRRAFRASKAERDEGAIKALLADAVSKLSYLRIVTPKQHGDAVDDVHVETRAQAPRDARAPNHLTATAMDPVSLRRHEASLQRFRFKGRK